jgi:hypothetical protein
VRLWGWDQVLSEPLPQEALQILWYWWGPIPLASTENCVRLYLFVFVFHRTKHGNNVLHKRQRKLFGLKTEGIAGGKTKSHSGELQVLYWWVNVGGEWTERQWDRWDKRSELEKLKKHSKFQLETLIGKGTWRDLVPNEVLEDNVINCM